MRADICKDMDIEWMPTFEHDNMEKQMGIKKYSSWRHTHAKWRNSSGSPRAFGTVRCLNGLHLPPERCHTLVTARSQSHACACRCN